MKRSHFARIIFAVVILGIWYYTVNGTIKTDYEENALLKGNSHLENETSGVEDKGTVQYQDCIVLDAEKWQGNYSKTFIVTDKTKVPISTLITVYFTYESNDNGGYTALDRCWCANFFRCGETDACDSNAITSSLRAESRKQYPAKLDAASLTIKNGITIGDAILRLRSICL